MTDTWAGWSTTAGSNVPVGANTPSDLHDQLQLIKAQCKANLTDRERSNCYAASAVGTDAYAITLTPALAAYANGQIFMFKADVANTGAATLAINALAVTDIKKYSGGAYVALETGDIIANQKCLVIYDSDASAFLLVNPCRPSGIVQVLNFTTGAYASGTTTVPYDDTIPQNTEGDEYLTLAITPKSTTNKLKIDITLNLQPIVNNAFIITSLFQDSGADALASVISYAISGNSTVVTFSHYMLAGTTSATTFKVRSGPNAANTLCLNGSGSRLLGGKMSSSITITETTA